MSRPLCGPEVVGPQAQFGLGQRSIIDAISRCPHFDEGNRRVPAIQYCSGEETVAVPAGNRLGRNREGSNMGVVLPFDGVEGSLLKFMGENRCGLYFTDADTGHGALLSIRMLTYI